MIGTTRACILSLLEIVGEARWSDFCFDMVFALFYLFSIYPIREHASLI
jgi:hypothetical protein